MSTDLRGDPIQALVEACWECPSVMCPIVAFDGDSRSCPLCGTLGTEVEDWAEERMEAAHQEALEEYGLNLCLDEIEGRATNVLQFFKDGSPKLNVDEELKGIVAAAGRLRPKQPGDS